MAFELPEAMTVARQMHAELVGKRITAAHLAHADSLIRQGFVNLEPEPFAATLAGRRIAAVSSQGKWIFVKLEPDLLLLLALETGGKVLYHRSAETLPARVQVRLDLDDGSFLTEQIVGWGWAKVLHEDELAAQRYPGQLGPSPLDEASPRDEGTFPYPAFDDILKRHAGRRVKEILLRQDEMAGIGNGYLHDILFRARVHPKRKAGDLTEGERQALHRAVVETMAEAVRLGGRESERDLYDRPGGYRPILGTHSKGQPCPACGTPIEKLSVQGTSSYVCPSCQT